MTYLFELAFEGAPRLLFSPDGTCFPHNDTSFTQDVKIKDKSLTDFLVVSNIH